MSSKSTPKPANSTRTPKRTSTRKGKAKVPPKQRSRQSQQNQHEETYFDIHGIEAEKDDPVRGKLYLIDWAGTDPVTGDPYERTWEPASYVTLDSIEKWDALQRDINQAIKEKTDNSIIPAADSQENEPVRPPKRKRNIYSVTSESTTKTQSPKPPSPKRPRRRGTANSARFHISREDEVSATVVDEVADSYEGAAEPEAQGLTPQYRVEVTLPDGFDRTAYTEIVGSLQSSLISIESQLDTNSSQRLSNYNAIYRDEGVIPDSQELPGSSSCIASESNIEAGSGAKSNTTTTTSEASTAGGATEKIRSPPSSHPGFAQAEDRRFEVPESSWSAQSRQISFLSASDEVGVASRVLEGLRPNSQPAVPTFTESHESQVRIDKSRSTSRLETSYSTHSSAFLPQFEGLSELPVARTRATWSTEIYRILSQVQSPQPIRTEAAESENFPFQTQVPYLRDNSIVDKTTLDNLLVERAISDDVGFQTQFSSVSTKESSPAKSTTLTTAAAEPHIRKNASSSFSGAWQGAQIIPCVDLVSPTISGNSKFEIFQESATAVTHQQNIENSDRCQASFETHSPLSQRDPNSQRSTTREEGSQANLGCAAASGKEIIQSITAAADNVIESIEPNDWPLSRPSLPSSGAPPFPDTYENQYPHRPSTPSPDDMADTGHLGDGPKLSVTDMLKQVRARSIAAAKSAAEARTKSPSEAPQAQPPAIESGPINQMLPVREAVIAPSIETSPPTPPPVILDEPLDVSEDVLQPQLGPMEHVVLLPMANFVRDVHTQSIYSLKNAITSFLNGDESAPLNEQMDALIADLKLLADHQDLTVDMNATQGRLSDEVQSKWAENCSTKCYFLKELFDAVRSSEIHIAVLARPGRMLDILEVMLKVNGYIYDRPDRSSRSSPSGQSPLTITLLPTGLAGGEYVVNRVDAVIAFDTTFFTAERYSKVLRAHLFEPKRLSPLISLVVSHTVEHLELCLAKDMDPALKRVQTIEFITQTRHMAGILSSDFPAPAQAALSVAEYLNGSANSIGEWPLPVNCAITGVELSADIATQSSGSTTQSHDYPHSHVPTPQGAMKRTYEDRFDEESTKRMRMTPIPGETPSTGDVTRVSESVVFQSHKTPVPLVEAIQAAIVATSSLDEAKSDPTSVLLSKVGALEIQVRDQGRTEAQLRQSIKDLEARLSSHAALINKIHPKYQEALKERAVAQTANNAAQAQVIAITERIGARIADIAKLKEEKAALQSELLTARTSLSTSVIAPVAELAQAQDTIRTLQTDNSRLEKRITNMQRDFDFTRDAYQKASTSAAELAAELSALRDESDVLRRQASSNLITIAEIQRSTANKAQDDRIDELEAQIAEYQSELARKNEELKAKMNGRRETRGTSVPRSPRLASGAMSPRPYVSIRIGGNASSRGNSPAPGVDSIGGGMNYGARDPVLFPPQQRWGHLRGEP